MLSRVANALYWLVRYIERADNLSRLIDVNQQLLLDFERLDSERLRAFWKPIVLSSGDEELFGELYDGEGSDEVIRFLTHDERNPNSIVSCIGQARENARTVRDQLPDDLWEELNSLYLFVNSEDASSQLRFEPHRFYECVRRASQTFLGIAGSTMARTEAWEFMELGRYLERADKTTRILDITSFLPAGEGADGAASLHWGAILRSCSGLGVFRAEYPGQMTPELVVRFLIFSQVFPRSVRFCLGRVDECLHRISGTARGSFGNDAERLAGQVLASLNFGVPSEVAGEGLHRFLDDLQGAFNGIGDSVFKTYVLMPDLLKPRTGGTGKAPPPVPLPSLAELEQMQQQQ